MAINYPWLLATLALFGLVFSKSFNPAPEQNRVPKFVGPPSEPIPRKNFLLRAIVSDTDIGNAFAVSLGKDTTPLVLTALHRFGPIGGLPLIPSPAVLAETAPSIRLITGSKVSIENASLSYLPIEATATLGLPSSAGDIACFTSNSSNLSPAPISSAFPDVGSVIWLAYPDDLGAQRSLRSIVFASDPESGIFYFRLPKDSLTLAEANANTGAPIIDLNGDVLGIHTGAASDSDTSPPYGLGQSTTKFLPHLLTPSPAQMATTDPAEPE